MIHKILFKVRLISYLMSSFMVHTVWSIHFLVTSGNFENKNPLLILSINILFKVIVNPLVISHHFGTESIGWR